LFFIRLQWFWNFAVLYIKLIWIAGKILRSNYCQNTVHLFFGYFDGDFKNINLPWWQNAPVTKYVLYCIYTVNFFPSSYDTSLREKQIFILMESDKTNHSRDVNCLKMTNNVYLVLKKVPSNFGGSTFKFKSARCINMYCTPAWVDKLSPRMPCQWPLRGDGVPSRVSCETNFDSKQPKLELKLVSETRCLFRLFTFNIETGSFGVSIEPKQQENNRNKPKEVLKILEF
jgi:hypothetical protein